MSTLSDATFRAQLRTDMLVAWTVTRIEDGFPLIPPPKDALDYGVIDLVRVEFVPSTVRTVRQVYVYDLYLVAKWPTADSLIEWKTTKANALITTLMDAVTYTSLGYMPEITGVELGEDLDDREEQTTGVKVSFSVSTDVDRVVL